MLLFTSLIAVRCCCCCCRCCHSPAVFMVPNAISPALQQPAAPPALGLMSRFAACCLQLPPAVVVAHTQCYRQSVVIRDCLQASGPFYLLHNSLISQPSKSCSRCCCCCCLPACLCWLFESRSSSFAASAGAATRRIKHVTRPATTTITTTAAAMACRELGQCWPKSMRCILYSVC